MPDQAAPGPATPVLVAAAPADRRSRSQQVARGVLAGVLILLGLVTLRDFLPALLWAVVFAIATWPLYQRTQRSWFPGGRDRIALPLLFTAVIALVFLVPLILLGLEVAREAQGVVAWMNHARQTGVPVPGWMHRLPLGRETATLWWQNHLSNPDDASDLFETMKTSGNLQVTRQVGGQVLHRATLFAFTLVTLFFLFRDGDRVVAQLLVASRRAFGERGEHIGRQVIASVHGTVDGLILVGLGEGFILGIAYGFVGAPHPPLFGALTAVAAMIPFGAALAIGIASVLVAAKGAMITGIGLFLFGLLVIFIADHFVRPVLIGGATQLPFLWVLLGILGGVEEWGLLGLFVGPAVMAALILLWRDWTRPLAPGETPAAKPGTGMVGQAGFEPTTPSPPD